MTSASSQQPEASLYNSSLRTTTFSVNNFTDPPYHHLLEYIHHGKLPNTLFPLRNCVTPHNPATTNTSNHKLTFSGNANRPSIRSLNLSLPPRPKISWRPLRPRRPRHAPRWRRPLCYPNVIQYLLFPPRQRTPPRSSPQKMGRDAR